LPHIVYQGEDRQQTNNAVVQYHIYQGDKAAAKPRIDFERQAQTEQSKAKQSKAKQSKAKKEKLPFFHTFRAKDVVINININITVGGTTICT
jgi:hypothetical protein